MVVVVVMMVVVVGPISVLLATFPVFSRPTSPFWDPNPHFNVLLGSTTAATAAVPPAAVPPAV